MVGDQSINRQAAAVEFQHRAELAEMIIPGAQGANIAPDEITTGRQLKSGLFPIKNHRASGAHRRGHIHVDVGLKRVSCTYPLASSSRQIEGGIGAQRLQGVARQVTGSDCSELALS